MSSGIRSWFIDWYYPSQVGCIYGVKHYISSFKTKYQQIDLVELPFFGKALFIDGKLQSSLYDEYIYHETLVHPAMLLHGNPSKVLILGGGEGATLREVLRYNCVKHVVMVDIDGDFIEYSKRNLVEWHRGSFDDPRVELVIADGRKYIEESKDAFDVIIADLVDPLEGGPAVYLYTLEFYRLIYDRLGDNGVFVTQSGSLYFQEDVLRTIYKTLTQVFPAVEVYHTFVPAFFSEWSFTIASKSGRRASEMKAEYIDEMLAKHRINGLRAYDGVTHSRIFVLTKDFRERLVRHSQIATDNEPIYIPLG